MRTMLDIFCHIILNFFIFYGPWILMVIYHSFSPRDTVTPILRARPEVQFLNSSRPDVKARNWVPRRTWFTNHIIWFLLQLKILAFEGGNHMTHMLHMICMSWDTTFDLFCAVYEYYYKSKNINDFTIQSLSWIGILFLPKHSFTEQWQ